MWTALHTNAVFKRVDSVRDLTNTIISDLVLINAIVLLYFSAEADCSTFHFLFSLLIIV